MNTFRQPFSNDWPITQKYGETITSPFHTGIDYGCPTGTNILAAESGIVRFAGLDMTGYGNLVIIEHDSEYSTLYAHLSLISVVVGQHVRKGEKIGESGNTGYSTGPHLHFEARKHWNDYRSHFDPKELPMVTVDNSIENFSSKSPHLINASKLKAGELKIVAPSGAFCHYNDFKDKFAARFGTKAEFTGNTQRRNGLDFCECLILTWIAAHDGETQILENVDKE